MISKKYVRGIKYPKKLIAAGIASLGNIKPDRSMLGSMTNTMDIIACSWFRAKVEMSIPIEREQKTNKNPSTSNNNKFPSIPTLNQNTHNDKAKRKLTHPIMI